MQSKLSSLLEATLNSLSGIFVAYMTWVYLVGPLFDISKPFWDNILITLIFASASVIRSYVWRRIFNKKVKK